MENSMKVSQKIWNRTTIWLGKNKSLKMVYINSFSDDEYIKELSDIEPSFNSWLNPLGHDVFKWLIITFNTYFVYCWN